MSARKKIMCVLGTRPEGIKLAPVIQELHRRRDRFELHVCSTAQHREMLDQVLRLFAIRPDSDLGVMRPDQAPGEVVGRILQRIDPILAQFKPDWMLVQGDTTTVAAASLAAFYRRIKVGHVEAGLRTYNRWEPFPEETHRRIAGILAERHFAATPGARANLLREATPADQILVTGNPVIDALRWTVQTPAPPELLPWTAPDGRKLILVTVHRRENLGEPLKQILSALKALARHHVEQVRIILPVHLNPQVRQPVFAALAGLENVVLTDPLDYRSMVHLLARAEFVLTDSGGLQEEAPALGKPVLVLREVTERPEAIAAGTARLVGTRAETILAEAERLLLEPAACEAMRHASNPFGDGRAAQRIVASLADEPVTEFHPASRTVDSAPLDLVSTSLP